MRKSVVKVLVLLLVLGVVSCSSPPPPASTVVLLVRHAEKASDAEDSPLTKAGVERSQALIGVAEAAGVSVIYTTQFKRNHETARPISERLNVRVTEVPVNLQTPGDYGKTLAQTIKDKHQGLTVLVVGHSNTIPLILAALTGRPAPADGVEYGDLYIVTLPPSGVAGLIKAQYGLGAAN